MLTLADVREYFRSVDIVTIIQRVGEDLSLCSVIQIQRHVHAGGGEGTIERDVSRLFRSSVSKTFLKQYSTIRLSRSFIFSLISILLYIDLKDKLARLNFELFTLTRNFNR